METVFENLSVGIPRSEIQFFKHFAEKMRWNINTKQSLWDKYINSCPIEVPLSDEDIMNELKTVRYGTV
ncbi:MAG: hypothetical protein LBV31_00565 [Prevotellaceae bacterium]|jgi:hypothetical protein|nr:hypothetical protein [Prevotellaceae bacterium]